MELSFLAAVIGALVTYLVAARRLSGKIASSEAKDLWEEAGKIRDWAYTEIDSLRKRLEAAERAHESCLKENAELRRRVSALENKI